MRAKDKLTRRVSWADQFPDVSQDDIDVVLPPNPIKLKYRSRQKSLPSDLGPSEGFDLTAGSLASKDGEEGHQGGPSKSPQSPSDLYKMINALTVSANELQPKSILKKKADSEGKFYVFPFPVFYSLLSS